MRCSGADSCWATAVSGTPINAMAQATHSATTRTIGPLLRLGMWRQRESGGEPSATLPHPVEVVQPLEGVTGGEFQVIFRLSASGLAVTRHEGECLPPSWITVSGAESGQPLGSAFGELASVRAVQSGYRRRSGCPLPFSGPRRVGLRDLARSVLLIARKACYPLPSWCYPGGRTTGGDRSDRVRAGGADRS